MHRQMASWDPHVLVFVASSMIYTYHNYSTYCSVRVVFNAFELYTQWQQRLYCVRIYSAVVAATSLTLYIRSVRRVFKVVCNIRSIAVRVFRGYALQPSTWLGSVTALLLSCTVLAPRRSARRWRNSAGRFGSWAIASARHWRCPRARTLEPCEQWSER